MFHDHTPPWATDEVLAAAADDLVFEITLYQVAITDAGMALAGETSAVLASIANES